LLEDFAVDAQLAELVDDHRDAAALGVVEHVAQQGGLPEPRKPVTMVTGSLASVFIGCPLARAGIRDESRCGVRAEEFATGSPRPVVVKICHEAGLLADGVRALGRHSLRLPAQWIELAVAWQRTSPFTVAGAAAA
jgi:hypothetical protein